MCDSYRAALLESEFKEKGLPLTQVRSGPITHAKVAPLIEQIFAEETLVFGDNPTMRWYSEQYLPRGRKRKHNLSKSAKNP